MKYQLIHAERACFPLTFMCEQLGVSRSGFYAWKQRPESARAVANRRLGLEIAAVHQESRGTYGSPRVQAELGARGRRVCRHRIARLMREQGLRAWCRRRFVATTDSRHGLPVASNTLARAFWPERPDVAWATDITYVATQEGWLYLAVVMDLFSRGIIGWAMGARIDRQLTLDALTMALAARAPEAGLLHHSDQGSQYASDDYQRALARHGIRCSMSRRGNCWDNAPVESFFGTLKTELVHHHRFATHVEAKAALFDYIEVFYNRRRRHSSLGYVSPMQYEQEALQRQAA